MLAPNKETWRLIAGIVMAPLIGAFVYMFCFALFVIVDLPEPDEFISFLGLALFYGAIIGWPAMLLLGLPVHAFILRKLKPHWLVYGLLGAIVGSAATMIFFAVLNHEFDPLMLRIAFLIGAPVGALSSIAFYLIRGPKTGSALEAAV